MTATTATSNAAAQEIWASLSARKEEKTSLMSETQDRFLKLLTTQLKNQDPLNPLDNAAVTSQLAQISTVDGIERLNATIGKLFAGFEESQALSAAALINRGVLAPGDRLALGEAGKAYAGLALTEDADRVEVTVKDANGLTIRKLDLGAATAGMTTFEWDGATDTGEAAAVGNYRFVVEAFRGGERISVQPLSYGMVDAVRRENGALKLEVGGLGAFDLSEVRQIF